MVTSILAAHLLVAVHTCLLIVGPTCAAPLAGAQYNQKPVGLMDFNGQKLTPPIYSRIEIAGRGCFLVSDLNSSNPYLCGDDRHLLNSAGRQINVPLPPGTKLRQILWFGNNADQHPLDLIKALPKDALVIFSSNNRLGICDANANVLVEPTFSCIGSFSDGAVLLSQQSKVPNEPLVNPPPMLPDEPPPNLLADHIFDANTRTLSQIPTNISSELSLYFFSEGLAPCTTAGRTELGYMDKSGQVIISPQFTKAGPFLNGWAAVQQQDGGQTIIDKKGNIVSPDNLDVRQFRGKYAIACERGSSPRLFGLVGKDFKFVVEPKYVSLYAILPLSGVRSPVGESTDTPDSYTGQDKTYSTRILSADAAVLSTFPAGLQTVAGYRGELVVQRWRRGEGGKSIVEFWDARGHKLDKFPDLPKPEDATVQVLTQDRLAYTLKVSPAPFDPQYWKQDRFGSVTRLEMFNRFLKQYNLIGMDVEDVLRFLGYGQGSVPDGYRGAFRTISYHLIPGGCTDPGTFAKLSFENGKVSHWCFGGTGSESTPIASNVVIDMQASERHLIGQQKYPVTQPK